jgi:hypothetical protein
MSMNHKGGRWAAHQRIVGARVQPQNLVAVEYLVTDLETGVREKLGRQLLDGEADCLRGAGKPPVADRMGSPALSDPGEGLLDLLPEREQLSHDVVVKSSHGQYMGMTGCKNYPARNKYLMIAEDHWLFAKTK